MKNRTTIKLVIITLMVMLIGSIGCAPPKIEKLVEIQPNQTAFIVPLEAGKDDQARFFSEGYLNDNKIAAKRISLPQRKIKTGRWWWNRMWIPTAKVIVVDRSPITRELTEKKKTGTSSTDQAIYVESKDSIGFGIGVTITAMIEEKDAAKFLNKYSGANLAYIMDNNIRGSIAANLSRGFADYDLDIGRANKNLIFEDTYKVVKEEYAIMGITITNMGLSEGLLYTDVEIQTAINETFRSKMLETVETNRNLAQEKINSRNLSIAITAKDSALEFKKAAEAQRAMIELEVIKMEAQARLTMAEKWSGNYPEKILPQNSTILLKE